MALTRVKRETIDVTLNLKGQGDTVKMDITYFNRKQSEVDALLADADGTGSKIPDIIAYMVKKWDSEYTLTRDGINELEDDRPGVVLAVIEGFHEARKMQKVKN